MRETVTVQARQAVAEVKDTTANPAPLGLLGFGMTTVLLNIHNAGFFGLDSMILGMGLFYGGVAQIIAGVMEWKKRNTFGTTAFTSYGLFWLTLVALLLFPRLGWAETPAPVSMAAYLFIWGLFTAAMFMGTWRLNRALQMVFGTLTVLFWLLALGNLFESTIIIRLAGYEGISCGGLAICTGLSQVLNELYGRELLPLGTAGK